MTRTDRQLRPLIAGLLGVVLAACVTGPHTVPATPEPGPVAGRLPPSLAYPGLFQRVARSGLVDPKDWVDAVPLAPADEINTAYAAQAPWTDEVLEDFVDQYFLLPMAGQAAGDYAPTERSMRAHIESLWPQLTRNADNTATGSLIPLPNAYIVPGGRFREVYYWDSYFTMAGLGPEHDAVKRNMVDNFAWLIRQVGHVPNANRTYYLSRSQPPFFFLMAGLLSPEDPAAAWADYVDELKTEHAYWTTGAHAVEMPDGSFLSRYWDARDVPRDESFIQDSETAERATRDKGMLYRNLRAGAESGWDFSSRWLADPDELATIRTTRIVPVDLNALLYGLEQAIAAGCERTGDTGCAADYAAWASARQAAMQANLWDSSTGAFMDFDLDTHELTGRVSAASLYPLFTGLATKAQAEATAGHVRQHLLAGGGLLATPLETGQQWDAPNGWAPLHWIAVQGLAAYGEDTLAEEIAHRWLATVSRTYCETGKMVEKYDVATARPGGGGEYPLQDGFGWTNGVTLALLDLYPDYASYGDTLPRTDAPETCRSMQPAN